MKVAIQIPIKSKSTRVPNKNFRDLCGKPLSFWLLDELVEKCPKGWDIYIDSEDEKNFNFFMKYSKRIRFHKRHSWFASDAANGNHLINQFAINNPQYDIYVQAYVTAVTLTGETICNSIENFIGNLEEHDSMFLAIKECGWVWYDDFAVNYRPTVPNGLPRSQDATYFKETTGLYATTKENVFKNACRVGKKPLIYEIDRREAADIDTHEDFIAVEEILNRRKNGKAQRLRN